MNYKNFLISKDSTVMEALNKIEINKNGFILLHDSNLKICGIATDGDIRRSLVKGLKTSELISKAANFNFISAKNDTPRELLLKQLDNKIRSIPILDDDNKLVSIISKDFLPDKSEEKIYFRSKSPVRISFGGGGSDTYSYFENNQGAVINATISIYTHSTLRLRDDKKIIIHSLDLKEKIEFEDIEELSNYKGSFSLIQSVIKTINPSFGFELFIYSDFPMSTGLGGSAVVISSILGCFNQLRHDKWNQYEISEIAFQSERLQLGISGGWQDQYATVFGGLNFMEFNKKQNIINPIRLNPEILLELEESLLLCYTGTTHDSGNIHDDQKKQTNNLEIKEKIQLNVKLTYEMRNYLLKGRLLEFGKSLHKAWGFKKSFSSMISNSKLDKIYNGAINNGAIGGKLLGAGGGGFFLFYTGQFNKLRLMYWLESQNLSYTPFIFEDKGLQSWTVREKQIKDEN